MHSVADSSVHTNYFRPFHGRENAVGDITASVTSRNVFVCPFLILRCFWLWRLEDVCREFSLWRELSTERLYLLHRPAKEHNSEVWAGRRLLLRFAMCVWSASRFPGLKIRPTYPCPFVKNIHFIISITMLAFHNLWSLRFTWLTDFSTEFNRNMIETMYKRHGTYRRSF